MRQQDRRRLSGFRLAAAAASVTLVGGLCAIGGSAAGEASVTLLTSQVPSHNHPMGALGASATTATPAGAYPAEGHGQGRGAYKIRTFAPSGTATSLIPAAIVPVGNGGPHNNVQPSLGMNWFIALVGIFPTRN